jgi:LDH2 family malate/lactate/ureidoglycolate dehydrogenase
VLSPAHAGTQRPLDTSNRDVTMLVDEGVRLAGARRLALQRAAADSGITVPDALLAQINSLAA